MLARWAQREQCPTILEIHVLHRRHGRAMESMWRGPTGQSTWRLGQLRRLCPPPVVPAKEGISFQPHRGQQCGDGSEGLDAAPADASWCTSDGRDRESHAGQDHRGGNAEQQSAVPAGEAQRRELLEGPKVQGSLKECGKEDGCHHGLHGPELADDKSFRQQLGSDFGFTRSSQPGGLPDRAGKDRLVQPGACKKGDGTTRRSHPDRRKPMTSSSLPLTTTMGSKVMKMVTMMTVTMSHLALQIAMDGRECLWEIACADNSWLTQAALNHGLPARRINYKQGFDLYKKSAWMEMERLRKIKRHKKLWLSLPCTHWCQWTNVNYNTDERKAVLEDLRRRDRRMMHYAKDFILNAVDDDPDIDVYWEWTFPCSGWSQPPMVSLQHGLLQRG